MAAPINTYDSPTNLSLGNIPQVEDEEIYSALLDLHNAIEILLTSSDDGDATFTAYITKQRNVTIVTGDYTVKVTDGLILTDTTAADITITMHPTSEGPGYEYDIKQIAGDNETLIVGDGGEEVDDDAGGITIDLYEAIPLKADDTNSKWWINN